METPDQENRCGFEVDTRITIRTQKQEIVTPMVSKEACKWFYIFHIFLCTTPRSEDNKRQPNSFTCAQQETTLGTELSQLAMVKLRELDQK